MALTFDAVRRLEAEPRLEDAARGFSAEVADAAWLLGRQWQLGEQRGEDASSPVRVFLRSRLTAIEPLGGDPAHDPKTTPAEAIVESEPEDFWTAGRRVLAGRALQTAAADAGTPLPDDPALALAGLPAPYDTLDGTGYDGRTLWRRRVALGLDETWFGDLRPPQPPPDDLWDPTEFAYVADFQAGEISLALHRHDGGDLDWYSVDASAPVPQPDSPVPETSLIPGQVSYPGAPLPRWWEIEDTGTDVGGYPPDRSHLATLLLIDLISGQSDDWFAFPVDAHPGHIVTLDELTVIDSFGDSWTVAPPTDWSLFATEGLSPRSLVVWSTVGTPLTGPALDKVVLGIDEDVNLVWAVERRLQGRDVPSDEVRATPPPAHLDSGARTGYRYRAATDVPRHWHPYVIDEVDGHRRFVQGRAADFSGQSVQLLPPPSSDLLSDPALDGAPPVHQIEPAAIPPDGVALERRARLARRTDGSPLLWTQRRRLPLRAAPAWPLRFDVFEPEPPEA